MHDVFQDLRYALRGLRHKPLFALIAVLSIAVGVGANASIFSIINALLLKPPAGINHAERVVDIGRSNRGNGFDTFSYPELQDIQQRVHSLDLVAGTRDVAFSYTNGTGAGERVLGLAVSQPYFDILGNTPQRGRFFTAAEDRPGTYVAVVTDDFWKKQMGGREDVVGATIELNRHPFTVIGVTRPAFHGHVPITPMQVFIPLTMFSVAKPGFNELQSRQSSWLTIVGRLAPSATLDRANNDLKSLFNSLATQYPDAYAESQRSAHALMLTGIPAAGHAVVASFLSLLMGMVGLVLLTTCANVAGMLLARAAGREREIAIRIAMGSGRARLMRQLLVESTLLFLMGGAAGLIVSTWGLRAMSRISLPVPVVLNLDFTPDKTVFLFGLALALVTGLFFGLVPAVQATKPNLVSALKNESGSKHSRGGRLRRIFVMAQVTFSLVLLACAGLFVHSLQKAARIDAGFNPGDVRVLSFNLELDGYTQDRGISMLQQLTHNLSGAPGVIAAAAATDLPLDMSSRGSQSYPDGYDKDGYNTNFTQVTANYFDALRIKTLQGRAFTESDGPASPKVVIVSKAYAAKVWPGQNPIGKTMRWEDRTSEERTVVGVVSDVKSQTVMEQTEPMVYLPLAQNYSGEVSLVMRSGMSAADANAIMLSQIRAIDSKVALTPIQTMTGITSVAVLPQRMAAIISGAMGLLALLLSAMGIYGVIAYMVTQRTREIGVRVALGARTEDVVGMIIRSGLRLALPGLIIGLAASFAVSKLAQSFILGVQPGDPVTFISVPLIILAMIAVATWVPARRASRITPMEALRTE